VSDSELKVYYKVYGYKMDFGQTEENVIHLLNMESTSEPNRPVYFRFVDKPKTNEYHRFLVNVILDDNSVLTDTTDLVFLKE
jgi:hypothetical protein